LTTIWKPKTLSRIHVVSRPLRECLTEQGSLTQRLRRYCGNNFNLELKNQTWSLPIHSESRLLRLRAGEKVLIREVLLKCDDINLVYARTVIPRTSLKGKNLVLQHLKTRPLGAILFTNSHALRKTIEYAKIDTSDTLYLCINEFTDHKENIWARRSVFQFNNKPLLITEFFLPAITKLQCE